MRGSVTELLPVCWVPVIPVNEPAPVLRVIRGETSLAVTQPIRFCADEAARIWIQAVRS